MTRIPYNPHTDNNGSIPEVGDFVAYNYSGQLATGWITRVSRIRRGAWSGPGYEIKMLRPDDGATSRVRGGPKCVLVLEKGVNGAPSSDPAA